MLTLLGLRGGIVVVRGSSALVPEPRPSYKHCPFSGGGWPLVLGRPPRSRDPLRRGVAHPDHRIRGRGVRRGRVGGGSN
ncbi:MAG: hypothetical protein LBI33_06030, partial [Propionibacteriaceae bacterium]|nr:hypothetical protein [Propionibacteriaceae bacterium]